MSSRSATSPSSASSWARTGPSQPVQRVPHGSATPAPRPPLRMNGSTASLSSSSSSSSWSRLVLSQCPSLRRVSHVLRNHLHATRKGLGSRSGWVGLLGLAAVALYGRRLLRVLPPPPPSSNRSSTSSSSSSSSARILWQPTCPLRQYPPHRYYHLSRQVYPQQPDFLYSTDTSSSSSSSSSSLNTVEYIFGEWPQVLTVQDGPIKLCVDPSSWSLTTAGSAPVPESGLRAAGGRTTPTPWPFADGTNPSIVTVARLQQEAPAVAAWLREHISPEATYVATACMTNSQCTWRDEHLPDRARYGLYADPAQQPTTPVTVRTVLLVLNGSGQPLAQQTVYLIRDAPWGRQFREPAASATARSAWHIPALDDARLFVHQQQLYVSYREGPGFGYDAQVFQPLHWAVEAPASSSSTTTTTSGSVFSAWTVTIRASETATFCCGRNMALLTPLRSSSSNSAAAALSGFATKALQSLTWVDPVTVIEVDTRPLVARSSSAGGRQARRLARGKHKSHIHGTNGFMVPIPADAVASWMKLHNHHDDPTRTHYLGVAHFHRPNDRNKNDYARFGHHYTHALFTVALTSTPVPSPSPSIQYRLTGLSAEFVLPSAYDPTDAEIIQFASGLEWQASSDNGDHQGAVLISYGINDCEAAMVTISWEVVQTWLRPVPPGTEVVDFMQPFQAGAEVK